MTSYRQIFRSSAIIGGSSAINIVIGIIKVKVLAVLLGPAGVGLMGLYQSIMSTASTLVGCGLGNSGVRQLAASTGDEATFDIVRRTLWLANIILGLFGMLLLWLLREKIALWVFGDTAHTMEVGWLGVGVLLTLVAASQTALLHGLRRIGDLALVNIISAMLGAMLGIILVYLLGEDGVLWFVLTAPGISIVVASYYTNRLPSRETTTDWRRIGKQWDIMLRLGIPIMAAGLLSLATQLAVRSVILRELGLDASGYFQAAWAISMTYIGFVLGAMGADYYPRLTAAIDDHNEARRLVNEQAEMALLMSGPVLLAMVTFAPWIIHLLYTENFDPATQVLRWQVLGDILKVASWPMGFILLAQGRGGYYLGTQLLWNFIYIGSILFGIRQYGLVMAGMGFLLAYLVLYVVTVFAAYKLIAFMPARSNVIISLSLVVVGGVVLFAGSIMPNIGLLIGVVSLLFASAVALYRLNSLIDITGWINTLGINKCSRKM